MPGVAALVNAASPVSKRIQLFYNTDGLNLALVLKSGDSSGDSDKTYAPKTTDKEGIIVNPSQLGAAQFAGINFVFGITQPVLADGQTAYTLYNVSIVSPVYQSLTTTEATNKSIAVTSSDTAVYVYYLGGTDSSSMKLKEYTLSTTPTSTSCDGTTNSGIRVGSSLAAYYDGSDRYVIYQCSSDSKILHEYKVGSSPSDSEISNADDAVSGATLGVVYVNSKVYLYYTDASYRLRRIIKDSSVWGSPTTVADTSNVDKTSQLTVVADNEVNNIFYLPSGDTDGTFTHVRDSTT